MRNSHQMTDATIRHVWDVAITRLAVLNALREAFGPRSPLTMRADRYNLNRKPTLTVMIRKDELTRRFFTSCREGFSARRFGPVYCWDMLETVALKQRVSRREIDWPLLVTPVLRQPIVEAQWNPHSVHLSRKSTTHSAALSRRLKI